MSIAGNLGFLLIALFISGHAQAQLGTLFKTNEKRGDILFSEFSYPEAIEEYKVALQKDPNSELTLKIAESYRKLNDPVNSSSWYSKAVKEEVSDPMVYLHYAEALSSLEQYDEAKVWYEKYSELSGGDERPLKKIKAINNLPKYLDRSADITTKRVEFNSEASDFSPEFYENDQIVFVSSRSSGKAFSAIFKWDNSEYLNLYITDTGSNVKFFQGEINTKYHEGPLSIYDKNSKMIFTRNNYLNNSLGANTKGVTKLKLYTSSRGTNGEWETPSEFKFNSEEYSVGHPAAAEDGKILVFTSDMPGGLGGTDLYKSEWINDQWSKPENLGDKINTAGNELFPYITDDSQLFFSSDGHGGFGGLDIFGIDFSQREDSLVVNLGKPFNSNLDDFALITKGGKGYFSSNREGSKNNDDIYAFETRAPLIQPYILKVRVTDKITEKPISGVFLNLKDPSGSLISQATTDIQGEYLFKIELPDRYTLGINKNDYDEDSVTVVIEGHKAPSIHSVALRQKDRRALEEVVKKTATGNSSELDSAIIIKVFYFDFDRFQIQQDAQKILSEVAEIMKQNENSKINITSHTDSRGSEEFNQQLSDKRFRSTVDYLTSQGIDKDRITGEGHGENGLANRCLDGTKCTDQEHKINRRTELRITKN